MQDEALGAVDPTAVDHALDAWTTAFEHLLKVVEDGGLGEHDDLGVVRLAQRFEQVRNRQALLDHRVAAELESRRVAESLNQPSTGALLAWALRISRGEAGRRVRAAEQVGERWAVTGGRLAPSRPALAAAQRRGDASPEQIDVCLRALATVDHRGFDPADLDAADELLAGFTAAFAPKRLAELAAQVVERIDPDGTLPTEEVDAERRHLALRTARDGMCVGELRLTPTLGAKLKAVLSPLAAPRNTVVGERDGRSVTELDPRRHGQRMHDALEEVCDRLLRSGTLPDSGGTPTTVIVTTTLVEPADPFHRPATTHSGSEEHLPGLDRLGQAWGSGTTSDGSHLSPAAVADLVDSAVCHPTIVDAKGVVLWMGRTSRLATAGQTMALVARDGGCSFPGCEHPPEWCERHHVVAWADGGPTDVDNLTLLCRFHHASSSRAAGRAGWSIGCRPGTHRAGSTPINAPSATPASPRDTSSAEGRCEDEGCYRPL